MSARRSDQWEAGPGDPVAWPKVNAAVGIFGAGWEHQARTRVEDRTGTHVVVARPTHAGSVPIIARAGDELSLTWTERDALYETKVVLSGTAEEPIPMWELQPYGPVRRSQRRSSFRLDVRLSALIGTDELPPSLARVHDLSEGGMRCDPPAEMGLTRGDAVWVRLPLPENELTLDARVVRVEPSSTATTTVGIAFEGMTETVAERIRQFLFSEQIARRARVAD